MAARYTQGTIKPATNLDAEKSASVLCKAMKGLGTDEKALIDVLTMHSNSQLQRIKEQYKTAYGQDVVEDLKSDLSGCFEKAVINRLCPSRLFHAHMLKKAMVGLGTDEAVLIEILCSATNAEMDGIKAAYFEEFGVDLEQEVVSQTSGHLRRIFVSQIQGNRDESVKIDSSVVDRDAQELFDAGEGQVGTDESVFNKILSVRSYPHLKEVFEKYKTLAGTTIEETIQSETSGDLQKAYVAIVKFTRNPLAFYAERLHDAMAGAGTDDDALIRILISHCEVDMVEIKAEFLAKYGKSLIDWVKGDVSGDYGSFMKRLVTGWEE